MTYSTFEYTKFTSYTAEASSHAGFAHICNVRMVCRVEDGLLTTIFAHKRGIK